MASRKQSKKAESHSKNSELFLSIISFLVSTWRTYIDLNSWAILLLFVILILIGEMFTRTGLILVTGIILYVVLKYVDNWLKRIR
jgi:hypothetical protein